MRSSRIAPSLRGIAAVIASFTIFAIGGDVSALPKEKAGAKRCGCTCKVETATNVWLRGVDVEIRGGFCSAKNGTSCSFVGDGVRRFGKREGCQEIDDAGNVISERPSILDPGTPQKPSPKAPRGERPDTNERAPG